MTELPPHLSVPSRWVNEKFLEGFFEGWETDNTIISGAEGALLTIQAHLDVLAASPGSPSAQDVSRRDVSRLRQIRKSLIDLAKTSGRRMVDASEGLVNLSMVLAAYNKLRDEHDRMVERTHESREQAEYYRQLLDEHHIDY